MCARYWNLIATLTCPQCHKTDTWNLQTHFMGYPGSFVHEYRLGEEIDELEGVNVLLDGRIDRFRGSCPTCEIYFDIGADIIAGKVEKVFILKPAEKISLVFR